MGEERIDARKTISRVVQLRHDLRVARSVVERGRAAFRLVRSVRTAWSAVRALPTITVELTDSRAGHEIADRLGARGTMITRDDVAAGLLVFPDTPEAYLRGKRRQALRTNITRARSAGVTVRRPDAGDLPREIELLLDAREDRVAYRTMLLGRVERGGGRFWMAYTPDDLPIALAVMLVDVPTAYLAWMLSDPSSDLASDARYLLSAEVFQDLIKEDVEHVITPSTLSLSPGLLHFQHLLGFEPTNIAWRIASPVGARRRAADALIRFTATGRRGP